MGENEDREQKAREKLGEAALKRLKADVAQDVERRAAQVEAIPQAVWDAAVLEDEGEGVGEAEEGIVATP